MIYRHGILNLAKFSFNMSNWTSIDADGTYVLFDTSDIDGITGSLAASGLSGSCNGFNYTLSPADFMQGTSPDRLW